MVKTLLLVALLGCQGEGHEAPRVETGSAAHDAGSHAGFGGHDAAPVIDATVDDRAAKPDEPEVLVDPTKAIIQLGAIPAWQAVVDRTLYLARRGQHGVVYGTIGPVETLPPPAGSGSGSGSAPVASTPAYVWLVDDTEGNGSLGIRVALGMKGAKEGDRVALGGAWQLDDTRHWFWKVDALSPLTPAKPSDSKDPRPAAPGHAIANGELPSGARTIGVAKDGDAVYFTVVGAAPTIDGDGWQVADELGNPTFAVMTLPGERASYGGQDMRAADERWSLKRGQTYWVRIGHFHKHGDKPQTVTARTAPVRVK